MCPKDFVRVESSVESFSAGCASELGTRVLLAIEDRVGSDLCGLGEVVGFEGPFVRLRFLELGGIPRASVRAIRASIAFVWGYSRGENQESSREGSTGLSEVSLDLLFARIERIISSYGFFPEPPVVGVSDFTP